MKAKISISEVVSPLRKPLTWRRGTPSIACLVYGLQWRSEHDTISAGSARRFNAAEKTNGGKIRLEGLQFNRDGSVVRRTSDPILDSAADILKSQPDTKVYVDSCCDPTGSSDVNLRLSGNRATAVAANLEHKGNRRGPVDSARIRRH